MTFDEIFQQYAQQGFTKPTMPQGIETIMPVEQIAKPIIQQPVSDNGGINNIITPGSYNPNIGKNFYDYEADAYGVGPTLQGGIAQLIDLYRSLPTPLNLVKKGMNYITDKFGDMAESQRIDAANRANVQSYIDSGGQSYDSQAQGTMYSDAASLGLE
ncbi:MAG: hypothetical protein O2933_05405 [Proteobacteria bacterium]|nr:hypothetical protein [Pseudomonadota bacterium]